jgi:hypothetical protein
MEAIMKRNAITIGLVMLFIAIAGAVSAQAQTPQRYRAEIPFDFSANGKHMTAGNYSVGLMASASGSGPLTIQSRDGKVTRILAISPHDSSSGTDNAKLVFLKTGNSYALAEVRTPDYGAKMKKTKTNVQQIAMADARSEIVIVSLLAGNKF